MSDYTTNASVNLTMNGEQPKKVLEELRNRAFNLENAIAKAAKAGNKTELTKLRKELKTTQRQIREMESATMQVERVLKQLDKATPKELQRTLKTLEKQLNNLERGSEAWKRQTEYIKQVRAEIDKVNRELRNGETFWERFNRKMNDWQTTLAAGAAAVTGVIMAGRSAVNAYAEMDAEMANVRKFTGMTAEQVALLNQEFQMIDTRTSREDLNRLAQEAGRLGKTSQEDVLGFVKAADQINVALDDLGVGTRIATGDRDYRVVHRRVFTYTQCDVTDGAEEQYDDCQYGGKHRTAYTEFRNVHNLLFLCYWNAMMFTAEPLRSCSVPEVRIVSPNSRPFTICISASVRIPVATSTGSALPLRYTKTLLLPISGTMASAGTAMASGISFCFRRMPAYWPESSSPFSLG